MPSSISPDLNEVPIPNQTSALSSGLNHPPVKDEPRGTHLAQAAMSIPLRIRSNLTIDTCNHVSSSQSPATTLIKQLLSPFAARHCSVPGQKSRPEAQKP